MQIALVRHGAAGSRSDWNEDDRLRELTQKGLAQATKVAEKLGSGGFVELHSSPYVRCVQTLEPLANQIDVEITLQNCLGEGNFNDSLDLVNQLVAADKSAVLCSHGDVIPSLVFHLSTRLSGSEASQTVTRPPRCAKGSIWLLSFDGQRLEQLDYHEPEV